MPTILDVAAAAADRAPSSHNTRPWRVTVSGDVLELRADPARRLPVNDPEDRELRMSCGAALLTIRVAAAHAGLRVEVDLLPAPDVLARATAVGPVEGDDLFAAIAGRRTHRRRFAPGAVDTGPLAAAAAAEGAVLHVLGGAERATLDELVAAGDRALARGSAVLAILATDGDDPPDHLRAGMALGRVLLTATAAGAGASFLNAPIQVPALRPRVAELLPGGVPQLALRLGRLP